MDPAAEHASELLVRQGERVPEAAERVRACYVDHRPAGSWVSAARGFRVVRAISSQHDIILSPDRGPL